MTCDLTAISLRLRQRFGNCTLIGSIRGEIEDVGEEGDVVRGEVGEMGEMGKGRMRFRAKIRPDESKSAEDELTKEIRFVLDSLSLLPPPPLLPLSLILISFYPHINSKPMFKLMQVVGQVRFHGI